MKLYLGKQTPEHKGDTSRELIDIWEERKYCEIIRDEVNDFFIWVNEPGDILIYEYDRWDCYPFLPSKWNLGLFGGQQHHEGKPYLYWGRRPKLLESQILLKAKSYDEREVESIFLGKCENSIQLANRSKESWQYYVEEFSMPILMGDSFHWPYTQTEYLEKVSNSKFGLDLAGFGPKTNRGIEYFALGVVPLVSPEVCMKFYNEPIEGKHYFRIKNGEDLEKTIKNCSKQQWEDMSNACMDWYKKNCSPKGSFETTLEIIDKYG